jgi:hypothetical protein
MGTLARKELRGLLPLMAALAAIELLGLADLLLLRFPDELSWSELSTLMSPDGNQVVAAMVLITAVIATYLQYPREYDHGTIAFLYSLPVHRDTIFLAKVASACIVVVGFCLADALITLALTQLNVSSLTGSQLRLQDWALETALTIGTGLVGVGYGMLISFFRRWGLTLAALLAGAASALPALVPWASHLSPLTLLEVEFIGSTIIVDPAPWRLHGIASAGALLLAWLLWRDHGERVTHLNQRLVRSTPARVLLALLVAVMVLAGTLTMYLPLLRGTGDADFDAGSRPISLHTRHYQFRYLPQDRDGALALSSIADAAHARIRALLGASVGARTVADLTETSPEHQGIAGWQTMRIERGVLRDRRLAAHVLYHETAHVLAAAESQRRIFDNAAYAAFFSEGLAEWVAHSSHDHPRAREALLDQAAASWQRFDLRFDELVDAGAFAARHDDWLVYALGYAWVSSLAQRCGEDAPGRILRAMAHDDAPRGLVGRRLWQDTLQRIDCDLDQVNAHFASTLDERTVAPARLPQLRASVVQVSETLLVFEVAVESPDPAREYEVSVRIRDSARGGRAGMSQSSTTVRAGRPSLVYLPNDGLSGRRFQFQVGVTFEEDEPPFFQRWVSATR